MKRGDIDNATHLLNILSLLNSRDQYCLWVHKIVSIKRITATAYWRGDGSAIMVNLKVNSSILPEARGERLCNR
jgi:hypothetical protein